MTALLACICNSEKLEELQYPLDARLTLNIKDTNKEIETIVLFCDNCKRLTVMDRKSIEPIGDGMWKYV